MKVFIFITLVASFAKAETAKITVSYPDGNSATYNFSKSAKKDSHSFESKLKGVNCSARFMNTDQAEVVIVTCEKGNKVDPFVDQNKAEHFAASSGTSCGDKSSSLFSLESKEKNSKKTERIVITISCDK